MERMDTQEKLDRLEINYDYLKEENKKLKEELKDLVEENIELNKKYMIVLTENNNLNKQIEQFKKGVKAGTNIIERLEEENQKLKEENKKLRYTLDNISFSL